MYVACVNITLFCGPITLDVGITLNTAGKKMVAKSSSDNQKGLVEPQLLSLINQFEGGVRGNTTENGEHNNE